MMRGPCADRRYTPTFKSANCQAILERARKATATVETDRGKKGKELCMT